MHYIPERRQPLLREYIRETFGDDRDQLSASDFRSHVSLRFPDGSSALFRNAFYICAASINETGVFTEHCGYHYFPYFDTEVELLNPVDSDLGAG